MYVCIYNFSKVLGTLVLLGGLAFKVPQIMKLQKNKSADGVSLSARSSLCNKKQKQQSTLQA